MGVIAAAVLWTLMAGFFVFLNFGGSEPDSIEKRDRDFESLQATVAASRMRAAR